MRAHAFWMVSVAAFVAGCVEGTQTSSTDPESNSVRVVQTSTREELLGETEFQLLPGQTASLDLSVPANATNVRLEFVLQDAAYATMTVSGVPGCEQSRGDIRFAPSLGGTTHYELVCGAVPAGEYTLQWSVDGVADGTLQVVATVESTRTE